MEKQKLLQWNEEPRQDVDDLIFFDQTGARVSQR